jgi:hypothetical protein
MGVGGGQGQAPKYAQSGEVGMVFAAEHNVNDDQMQGQDDGGPRERKRGKEEIFRLGRLARAMADGCSRVGGRICFQGRGAAVGCREQHCTPSTRSTRSSLPSTTCN